MASPGSSHTPTPPKKDKLEVTMSHTPKPPNEVNEVNAKRVGNKIYANTKDDWESVSSIGVGGETFRTKIKLRFDVQLCPKRSIDLFSHLPLIRQYTYKSNLAVSMRCDQVGILTCRAVHTEPQGGLNPTLVTRGQRMMRSPLSSPWRS